jgi:glucose/arabinose dehydrogenase
MTLSPRRLIALLLAPLTAAAADPQHGRELFTQSCALCHATVAGPDGLPVSGQGPGLAGIVGRAAGALGNFSYTKALSGSGIVWDEERIARFLEAPSAMVPGTLMAVAVADADSRRDIAAYLATVPAPAALSGTVARAHGPALPDVGDWTHDAPGVQHAVVLGDMPAPFATASAGNGPHVVERPAGAAPSVPPGFTVRPFATYLSGPRQLRTAPNGDLFVAETREGRIRVLRADDGAAAPREDVVFASGLRGPFGIAFYPLGDNPRWVYVAENNAVVRYPYHSGDLRAGGPAQTVVDTLAGTTGGHTTRDIAFSNDGRRLFISVGSGSNVAEGMVTKEPEEVQGWEAVHGFGAAYGSETNRANILVTDPEGRAALRTYATGIRNPVGLAVDRQTGVLWTTTNERDGLGDNLVPDYITRVREGAFYGWPWYYMGSHEDPRHAGERPDLAGLVTVPDVPVQSHSAALGMVFYTATAGAAAFPEEYRGDAFVAFHGSWNRSARTGYKVVRLRRHNGVPTGEYDDFLTGFVVDASRVWGRPVGVAVARDGALIVTDDASDTVWRIAPLVSR